MTIFRLFGLLGRFCVGRFTAHLRVHGTSEIAGRDAWRNAVGRAVARGTGRQSRRVHPAVDPARLRGAPQLAERVGAVDPMRSTLRAPRLDTWRHPGVSGAADRPPHVHFEGPKDSSARIWGPNPKASFGIFGYKYLP